jgi:hypothetical protein
MGPCPAFAGMGSFDYLVVRRADRNFAQDDTFI